MSDTALLPMPDGNTSPQALDPDHYEAFDRAMSNVLGTDIARQTIAQLMDGIPLYPVHSLKSGLINFQGAPVQKHLELCPNAQENADKFIANFRPAQLQLNSSLLQHFQNAELDSEAFLIRLIELVARSIHCIAVSIDKTAQKCHVGDIQEAVQYREPSRFIPLGRGSMMELKSLPPYASLFYHADYTEHEKYPFGASDLAGFWAEDQIFGGVVLFDRGNSGTESNSVWLHSGRYEWTRRIWRPLDWQLRAMKQFFHSGRLEDIAVEADKRAAQLSAAQLAVMHKPWKAGFPFFCDVDNVVRHDEYDAMAYKHIYRDPWERSLPPHPPPGDRPLDTFNYPELQGFVDAIMYAPDPRHGTGATATHVPGEKRRRSSVDDDDDDDTCNGGSKAEVDGNDVEAHVTGRGTGSSSRSKVRHRGRLRSDSLERSVDGDDGPKAAAVEDNPNLLGTFDGKTFKYKNKHVEDQVRKEKERVASEMRTGSTAKH